MARDVRYALGIWALTSMIDRFCVDGYRDELDTRRQFELAAAIEGLDGIILQCPNVISPQNVAETRRLSEDSGVPIAGIDANVFQKEFKWGAISNADPQLRRQAVDIVKSTMDVAAEVGCDHIGLWLGQDGFDYPFQENYLEVWDRLRDGVAQCADHNAGVRLCVEPKTAEPRGHLFLGSVSKAMALCHEVGRDNVGVTVDIGHVYMSRESPAEAAMFAAKHGKLFDIHFNDARGYFDDDFMAGSVHVWDTIEFLYYMEQVDYDGWYGFDIFPYREDLRRAAELSIRNIRQLREVALRIDPAELKRRQATGDSIATQEYVREMLFRDLG